MSVNDWIYEAVNKHPNGANVREVQRYIDEHHFEELAIDTIQKALQQLTKAGRIAQEEDTWKVVKRTSKEDAMKKLFG